MFTETLQGKDNANIRYGVTLNAGEVPSKNSWRIGFDFRQNPPKAIIVDEVIEGKWQKVDKDSILQMANAVLPNHLDVDIPLTDLKKHQYMYLVVFEINKADPFANLTNIGNELDLINNAPNPRLAESKFVANYMYFFLNDVEVEKKRDPDYEKLLDAAMKHWQVHVTSFNRDVDVYDDRAAGEPVLFTIPALIGRDQIINLARGKRSLEQHLSDSRFEAQLNPAGGERILENGLSEIIIPRTTQYRDLERAQLEKWDQIRLRYNYPAILPTIAGAGAVVAANKTQPVDDSPADKGFDDDETGSF